MGNLTKVASKTASKAGAGTGIPMETCTRASGRTTLRKVKVQCGIQIKINTKDNGSKARKMDGANTFTTMEPFTRETS